MFAQSARLSGRCGHSCCYSAQLSREEMYSISPGITCHGRLDDGGEARERLGREGGPKASVRVDGARMCRQKHKLVCTCVAGVSECMVCVGGASNHAPDHAPCASSVLCLSSTTGTEMPVSSSTAAGSGDGGTDGHGAMVGRGVKR